MQIKELLNAISGDTFILGSRFHIRGQTLMCDNTIIARMLSGDSTQGKDESVLFILDYCGKFINELTVISNCIYLYLQENPEIEKKLKVIRVTEKTLMYEGTPSDPIYIKDYILNMIISPLYDIVKPTNDSYLDTGETKEDYYARMVSAYTSNLGDIGYLINDSCLLDWKEKDVSGWLEEVITYPSRRNNRLVDALSILIDYKKVSNDILTEENKEACVEAFFKYIRPVANSVDAYQVEKFRTVYFPKNYTQYKIAHLIPDLKVMNRYWCEYRDEGKYCIFNDVMDALEYSPVIFKKGLSLKFKTIVTNDFNEKVFCVLDVDWMVESLKKIREQMGAQTPRYVLDMLYNFRDKEE